MDMKAQFFTINSVPAVLYGEAEAAHVHIYDDGAAVGGELVHKGDYLIAAGLVVENNAPELLPDSVSDPA